MMLRMQHVLIRGRSRSCWENVVIMSWWEDAACHIMWDLLSCLDGRAAIHMVEWRTMFWSDDAVYLDGKTQQAMLWDNAACDIIGSRSLSWWRTIHAIWWDDAACRNLRTQHAIWWGGTACLEGRAQLLLMGGRSMPWSMPHHILIGGRSMSWLVAHHILMGGRRMFCSENAACLVARTQYVLMRGCNMPYDGMT